MALPVIIIVASAIAATAGIGNGVHGGVKMKKAKNTIKDAEKVQHAAVDKFEKENAVINEIMDSIGVEEMTILADFNRFSDLLEQIQGRPEFKEYSKDGVVIPKYNPEEIKKVSTGAAVLIGGLSGAAAGTAGGFAAAGATTSAVMALGTASTGTAIASLSGAAATNATLAALGGGSIAAGGGGMAAGSAVLGGAAAGVAILVGGIIFNITGCTLSKKADEAMEQAKKTEREVDEICVYLSELGKYANRFKAALDKVNAEYERHMCSLVHIITNLKKTNWNDYTGEERMFVENTCLLVGLLYKMCQVKLVLKTDEDGINEVNIEEIDASINSADDLLSQISTAA